MTNRNPPVKRLGPARQRPGEVIPVELFVAVLGASNFTYAEATLSQQRNDRSQSRRPHSLHVCQVQGLETAGQRVRVSRPADDSRA
jgi:hypothetical protein